VKRLLLLLAGLLLLAACGVPQEEEPRALDRDAAPFRVFERDVAPQVQGDLDVRLYFVRGERLEPVVRSVDAPGSPRQVLDALFTGLTEEERSTGLSSSIPSTVSIVQVELRERIAVVTLDGLNEQAQVLLFAQIVATLDDRPEIDGVRFRTTDRDLAVPRGDSSLTDAPVDRSSYAEQLGEAAGASGVPPPPVNPAPTVEGAPEEAPAG